MILLPIMNMSVNEYEFFHKNYHHHPHENQCFWYSARGARLRCCATPAMTAGRARGIGAREPRLIDFGYFYLY